MALAHLSDPDNASSAYAQAALLDLKDPAIPLNHAVLKHNIGDQSACLLQMKDFEDRVFKLRETPGLDADPDVRTPFRCRKVELMGSVLC